MLPDSVVSLGDQCFHSTSISSLTLSNGLKELPYFCFTYGALTSLTIPENLRVIGPYSFQGQGNLKEVHLPAGLETIASDAFEGTEAAIFAPAGSYATAWAMSRGLALIPE